MKRIYILTVLILLSLVFRVSGQAISVQPLMVEIENDQRAAEIWILNTSNETKTYRAVFEEYRMIETGRLLKLEEEYDDIQKASDYVRVYPETITLGPGESQTVRIQSRLPRDLGDVELRSHLSFQELSRGHDQEELLGYTQEELEEEGAVALSIQMNVGISIPVFVRNGDLHAEVEIKSAELVKDNDPPYLQLNVTRLGNRSARGDVQVFHVSPEGREVLVGTRSLTIYTPLEDRVSRIGLTELEDVDLNSGKIKLKYEYNRDSGSRDFQMAETEIQIN